MTFREELLGILKKAQERKKALEILLSNHEKRLRDCQETVLSLEHELEDINEAFRLLMPLESQGIQPLESQGVRKSPEPMRLEASTGGSTKPSLPKGYRRREILTLLSSGINDIKKIRVRVYGPGNKGVRAMRGVLRDMTSTGLIKVENGKIRLLNSDLPSKPILGSVSETLARLFSDSQGTQHLTIQHLYRYVGSQLGMRPEDSRVHNRVKDSLELLIRKQLVKRVHRGVYAQGTGN